MLKFNFMSGKSVRSLAFSLVTASSLISLLSPSHAMDAPQESLKKRLAHELLVATLRAGKEASAAKTAMKEAEKEFDEVINLFSQEFTKNSDSVETKNLKQKWSEVEAKKEQRTQEYKKAYAEYERLRQIRTNQIAAKPKGRRTEKSMLTEAKFDESLSFLEKAKIALELKKIREADTLLQDADFAHMEADNALEDVIEEVKAEQNAEQKEFLNSIVKNLLKYKTILATQIAELQEKQNLAEAEANKPVVRVTGHTFTRPADEAAKAEAEKIKAEQAAAKAAAEARVADEAQRQLAAHQKRMNEEAEQKRQAAATVQPKPAVPSGRALPRVPVPAPVRVPVLVPVRAQSPAPVQPPVQDNSMAGLAQAFQKALSGEKNGLNDATLEAGRICTNGGMRDKRQMVEGLLNGGTQQKRQVEKPADAPANQHVPFVAMKRGAPPPPSPAKPVEKPVKKQVVVKEEVINQVQVTKKEQVMAEDLLRAMAFNAGKRHSDPDEDEIWDENN